LSFAALLGVAVPASADSSPSPETSPGADAQVSVVAPPAPEGLNRVELKLRPFLGLVGNSWGGIGELRVEHYFRSPFMVGLELAPLALANAGEGMGAIAQARVHGAFVTRYLSVGLGVGGQLQRFGRSGLSIAPTLRLGSLDGLSFRIEYAYSVAANQYTGKRTIGFSNLLAGLQVPLTRRLALEVDTGLALESWAFATVGLRHRLYGEGGPGTWFVTGAFGGAWISDQGSCNYTLDFPCPASAHSFGPTVMFGLERRF
jgi:hypothetical protein